MEDNKTTQREKKYLGFTLIELLVTISIIGILSTLLLSNINTARERARDAQRKSDLKNIQTALRLYYNDKGKYPAASSARIAGCGLQGITACAWGDPWTVGNTTYMSTLPKDPLDDGVTNMYRYASSGSDNYTLSACLENKSDDKGKPTTESWCPSGWMIQVTP
jgi:prepilin-type N-terminal cleavage/methylation domain-containing protein